MNKQSKLYRCWKNMRYACDNPKNNMYHNYGALGITYIPEWNSFSCFESWALSNGYAPGLSLSRIDKDKNFTPSNCRWIPKHTRRGDSQTNLYSVWNNMRQRCDNPKHKSFYAYGGRGIKVCPEWEYFINFKNWATNNGYSEGLTLDRINNNGDYSPDNCHWVPIIEQCNNRRTNLYITWNGETKTIAQWARMLGIDSHLLWSRIHTYHMPVEQAFTMPVGASRGKNHFEKQITFNGITLNQKQWAEKIGISPTTLMRRLRKMPIAEALKSER